MLDNNDRNREPLARDAENAPQRTDLSPDRPSSRAHRTAVIFYRVRLRPDVALDEVSAGIHRMTGHAVDEFVDDPDLIRRVVHPDDRARLETLLADPSQAPGASGLRLVHRDGRILETEHVALVVRDGRGDATAVEGLIRDVTTLRDGSDRSAETDASARNLDEIPAVVYVADAAGFTHLSRNIQELTGFAADEWMRQPTLWVERLHPDDRARLLFLSTAGAAGQPWQAEYRWLARDGRIVWIRQASAPIRNRQGHLLCLHGFMRACDAGQPSGLPSRESARMDAIGRAAGVVAHDFNNLMTVVLGHAEMLLDTFREPGPARGSALEIKNAAETAARVTNQWLAASGRQGLAPAVVNLNSLVRGLADTLHQLAGGDVDVRFDLASELPAADVDEPQMARVLRNLVVGACEAMPGGGRILISTRTVVLADRREVCLTVSDTRGQLTDDAVAHIFEPTFSNKKSTRGAGLNRAAIYGIVRQSGGRIAVASSASRGTTFTISLPARER